MTMIYFAGRRLDHEAATDPVVIRGYDAAGNLLSAIRYGLADAVQYVESGQPRWRFAGFDADGNAVEASATVEPPRAWPTALAADRAGRLYAASGSLVAYAAGQPTEVFVDWFRVYNRNGDRVPFPQLHGARIRAIQLDGAGNIYIGGDAVGAGKTVLRKVDPAGTLLWSAAADSARADLRDTVYAIALDGSGNVYTAGGKSVGGGLIRKYDAAGNLLWTQRPAGMPLSVALDGSGNIYTGGMLGAGYWLGPNEFQPWNVLPGYFGSGPPAGSFAWYTPAHDMRGVVKWAASDGAFLGAAHEYEETRIAFGGGKIHAVFANSTVNYRTFDAGLTLLQERDIGWTRSAAAPVVSSTGTRTFAGARTSVPTAVENLYHYFAQTAADVDPWAGKVATMARGVTDQGALRADAGYPALEFTHPYGMTVGPDRGLNSTGGAEFWDGAVAIALVENTQTPGLALGLGLGLPTWRGDQISRAPGLPLGLGLGLPVARREYVGALPLPDVYRLAVDGAPELALPLKSVQCRRSLTGLTVTAVVPVATVDLVDALIARVGNDLIVRRGIRFTDGVEQVEEFLRAPLTSIRSDTGASAGSMTLVASLAAPATSAQTRALRGISYRAGLTGSRRVRCAIDTFLRPGDTADLGGGETLVAGEIVYAIAPESGTMEVAE